MKKFILLVLTVFMTTSLFAQNAKSTGLTDKDVQNFAKHFNAISAEMERTFGDAENQNYVQKKSDYVKAEKILNKYGFTGSNVVEKYAMMNSCIGVINLEKSGMAGMLGKNALAAQMKYINQDDYDVVERNWDVLAKAINIDGINEEVDEEIAEERRRDEEEEAEYQAQVNAMMADIMGMLGSGKKTAGIIPANNKNLKPTFDSEVKTFKGYLNKFDSVSKKDVGFIYKKYDKAHASQYKLTDSSKSMAYDDGYTFQSYSPKFEGTQAEVYFQFNAIGARISFTMDKDDASDCIESTKTEVKKWEIYSCNSGTEIVYYLSDSRIVHVWCDANSERAVLEADTFVLEGQYSYSPC